MHSVEELIFKFKESLNVLNRSPATIKAYLMHAEIFLKSMNVPDITQVTTTMIENYIAGLYDYRTEKGEPYTIGTICIKVRSIKRFFEFLEKTNIIFIDPAEFITEPQKKQTRIKETLTPQEARKILDQPNLGTLSGIRDRAVMEMFYSTGIRLNELCTLTIFDADLQGGVVRVKGKGNKDRVVPIGKHAVRFLREYITRVRPHFTKRARSSRHLFVNYYGNPLSKQVVSIMIRDYRRAAKIKKQVTAHTFRHTFATVLIKNRADIRAVQKMMGHVDLSTTQTYIRSLGIDIKKEHQKAHPRERDKEDIKQATPKLERKKGPYERK
ncbi:MAG: tyrosine-type recombinase/integrase [Thermodesulfobacteriota bacterium]|nr:tyrosine-type recombinase/integrase [Thermodesulfobacteriota bacterium]